MSEPPVIDAMRALLLCIKHFNFQMYVQETTAPRTDNKDLAIARAWMELADARWLVHLHHESRSYL